MAGNQRIIEHSGFKAAIDSDYINLSPKSSIQFFEDSKNLSPHDKIGSLSQCEGHSIYSAYASLPNVSGYKPVDFYYFSIDRDEKEITLVVLENTSTGEIKYFITPFFNPDVQFSNYNSNYTANSWINSWLELTERVEGSINAVSSSTTFTVNNVTKGVLSGANHYYDGWFVLNVSYGLNNIPRQCMFNYISSYDGTTFTTKAEITGTANWTSTDKILLIRFPVVALYSQPANSLGYQLDGSNFPIFKGKPTDYSRKNNQLRIPCGKDNRPLIIDCIYKRKYMVGGVDGSATEYSNMSYDGLWFDFQQIPQVQHNSATTGFASDFTNPFTGNWYIDCATGAWSSSAPANGLKINSRFGNQSLTIIKQSSLNIILTSMAIVAEESSNTKYIVIGKKEDGNWVIAFLSTGSTTYTYTATNQSIIDVIANSGNLADFRTKFLVTKEGATTAITVDSYNNSFIERIIGQTVSGSHGQEAGLNRLSSNIFAGVSLYNSDKTSGVDVHQSVYILSVIYDKRNELMISHGTVCMTGSGKGFEVRFGLWFSRRLTDMNLYLKQLSTDHQTVEALVFNSNSDYPSYVWKSYYGTSNTLFNINETPLFGTFSLENIYEPKNSLLNYAYVNIQDIGAGVNAYTFKKSTGYWYSKFLDTINGTDTTGTMVRFIVNTNRYLDQDITMNYERLAFIGQTNGRYFLINCKNSVEKELFENNDQVIPSLYAYGVSQYDVYLRDRALPIVQGDKDSNISISNLGSRMFICKESHNAILEVNTDTDIKYRVNEQLSGDGTRFPDGILETPNGIMIPTDEGISIFTGQSYISLLNQDDGKLKLYRDLIETLDATVIGSAYSNSKKQAYFFVQYIDDSESPFVYTTYIFIYNFRLKTWTYQFLQGNYTSGEAGIIPIKVRTNFNKDILFLNYYNTTNYNIIKIEATNGSTTFFKADGTSQPILWNFETIFTAYNGVFNNISLEKIWLNINAITSGNHNLTLRIYLDNISTYNDYSYPLNTVNFKNFIAEILPTITKSPTFIKIQLFNNSALESFCLNNLLALDNSDKKNFTNDNA